MNLLDMIFWTAGALMFLGWVTWVLVDLRTRIDQHSTDILNLNYLIQNLHARLNEDDSDAGDSGDDDSFADDDWDVSGGPTPLPSSGEGT